VTTEPLHVLVYGTLDAAACDLLRVGVYREPLGGHGVELRAWSEFEDALTGRAAGWEGIEGVLAPIAWADVIVFRRWRSTAPRCTECGLLAASTDELAAHVRTSGHLTLVPDPLVRLLWELLVSHPSLLGGAAIVYETDDDVLDYPDWTGFGPASRPERDLVEAMLRRADLVTVSTPVLAALAARYNDAVRVVRNAVDPAWYAGAPDGPPPPGDPRILYYGVPVRLRDYALCRAAVDGLRAERPTTRRVWLGAAHDRAVRAAVDEALPYVEGVPAFARALRDARPDIGLAPVLDEPFNRAKSELHWLEYTLAGAATIASRTRGPGPYDVIRDGVDGLLAATPADWSRHLRALAGSAGLRAELVGAARERILADYTVAARAPEWAAAYRWAAEHAGRGRLGRGRLRRGHPVDDAALAAVRRRASADLDHRLRARAATADGPAILARLRDGRDVGWAPRADEDPLVSIVVPFLDEPEDALDATLAAALGQTHRRLEVLVVGGDSDRAHRVRLPGDPRLRLVGFPAPAPEVLPDEATDGSGARREAMAALALDAGLAVVRGAWVVTLPVGVLLEPGAVALLLEVVLEHRLEFVYGQVRVEIEPGAWLTVGAWPPGSDPVIGGSELAAAPLRVFGHDPEAWREGESIQRNRWRRLVEAGVRVANVEAIVATVPRTTSTGEPTGEPTGAGARAAVGRAGRP